MPTYLVTDFDSAFDRDLSKRVSNPGLKAKILIAI